jgi:bile acid-coenzyme A ligase
MYHNGPFTNVHWALAWGCHVIEMARFDPLEWLRLVERHRVRWAYMVPTMMNRIWALPEEVRNGFDLSSLRVVMHMAAPCPQWLKEAWINWLGPQKIWEVYAGTEAFAGSVISGEAWLTHRGSVGVPGTPTAILDADGEPLPTGEIGEIYFRNPNGPGTTFVYRGAEASRRGDWETYGDMGYLDDEGYLYLADRRTDMIISGGANIFPAEVESALEQHPAIASAVVVGLPDHDLGARVHAVLEPRSGQSEPAPGDVIAFLRERLAGYKLPYTYDIVDQPLRDDAGKVRRALVRDSRIARRDAGETFPTLRGA